MATTRGGDPRDLAQDEISRLLAPWRQSTKKKNGGDPRRQGGRKRALPPLAPEGTKDGDLQRAIVREPFVKERPTRRVAEELLKATSWAYRDRWKSMTPDEKGNALRRAAAILIDRTFHRPPGLRAAIYIENGILHADWRRIGGLLRDELAPVVASSLDAPLPSGDPIGSLVAAKGCVDGVNAIEVVELMDRVELAIRKARLTSPRRKIALDTMTLARAGIVPRSFGSREHERLLRTHTSLGMSHPGFLKAWRVIVKETARSDPGLASYFRTAG